MASSSKASSHKQISHVLEGLRSIRDLLMLNISYHGFKFPDPNPIFVKLAYQGKSGRTWWTRSKQSIICWSQRDGEPWLALLLVTKTLDLYVRDGEPWLALPLVTKTLDLYVRDGEPWLALPLVTKTLDLYIRDGEPWHCTLPLVTKTLDLYVRDGEPWLALPLVTKTLDLYIRDGEPWHCTLPLVTKTLDLYVRDGEPWLALPLVTKTQDLYMQVAHLRSRLSVDIEERASSVVSTQKQANSLRIKTATAPRVLQLPGELIRGRGKADGSECSNSWRLKGHSDFFKSAFLQPPHA